MNPYPTIRKVAVAPFINLSNNPAVDGRHVAASYFAELQKIPGFEVVPVGVVETAMMQHGLTLQGAGEAQELARALQVDCVVVGAISDFTPYYPPRLAMHIEWYAANGFGAPFADNVELAAAEFEDETEPPLPLLQPSPSEPRLLPDAELQSPPMPSPSPLLPVPGGPPLLTYTRLFDGADDEFTEALHDYVVLRDDARFGGEQGYLQRTDDFVRFACHQAIYEMLGRTPGGVETRLVFQWPKRR